MRRAKRLAAVLAACGVIVAAVGCGGDDATADAGSTSEITSAPETTPIDTAPIGTSDTTPPEATGKVSANDASAEEIAAALEAAGVDNAERWTREVMEYRPYSTDDPSLAQLRKELLKYNPLPDQLELILGALEP
jgi:competence protein ComEA